MLLHFTGLSENKNRLSLKTVCRQKCVQHETAQNAACTVTVSFSNTESYAVSGITLISTKIIHRDRLYFIAVALDRYDLETYEIIIKSISIRILYFK